MKTTQIMSIQYGKAIHFNGMVMCLMANRKLRVEWMNLEGEPFVLLNPGDKAFNYVDAKMITFAECGNNGNGSVVFEGGKANSITMVTMSPSPHGSDMKIATILNDGNSYYFDRMLVKITKLQDYLFHMANMNYELHFPLMVW